MTSDEILGFLREHKTEIAERFGVASHGVAGSFARGEAKEDNEIDIIADLHSHNTFHSFFGLLHYLQDALPHKIDLATSASIKPLVREQIMKDIRYV